MKTGNVFATTALQVADAWEKEAEQRKQRTPSDPAADAIASCASELRSVMADVERATAHLTVQQFAKARGMDESTVRRLCAQGRLEGATKDDASGDWRIPREARRLALARRRFAS